MKAPVVRLLKDDIVDNVDLNRASNTTYSDLEIIEQMINNNILGNHIFFLLQ